MKVGNPFPLWLDQRGYLIDAGRIYVGAVDSDPEVSPIQLYWDAAYTVPATQPILTRGGVAVNNGAPALFYANAADYSLRVRDADLNLVMYAPSIADSVGISYQPLDADLTAIAAQTNAPFGLSLLTSVTAAAARGLLGIANWIASTGGTVTGNIIRSGAGPLPYWADPAMVSGQIIVTDAGAADPTTLVGDLWIELEP